MGYYRLGYFSLKKLMGKGCSETLPIMRKLFTKPVIGAQFWVWV